MHGPAVVSWLLAALAAGSGGYCLRRAHTCAPGHGAQRGLDTTEAAMGLGMAGMAVAPGVLWGWLAALPAGALLLGALGPGAAGLRGHRLHHGIGALAMAYMALAMPAAHEHAHHAAPAGLPLLTGALLLYFGGWSLWAAGRLLSTAGPARTGALLSESCRTAMGIGMFAMLLTM